jgi:hypothetical protein
LISPVVLGVYVLGIVLFAAVFAATRLPDSFGQVTAMAKSALGVIRDPGLDDDIKEETARRASWNLLGQGLVVFGKGTLSIAGALLPFWAADALGWVSWNETLGFASRLDVLGVTTLLAFAIWLLWRRLGLRR